MNYEGIFILDTEVPSDAVKKTVDAVSESIKKEGGMVNEVQEWGRRRLAHLAKKRREGYYMVVNFSLEPEKVKPLQGQFRLNERILKSMLTQKKVFRKRKIRVRKPKREKSENPQGAA